MLQLAARQTDPGAESLNPSFKNWDGSSDSPLAIQAILTPVTKQQHSRSFYRARFVGTEVWLAYDATYVMMCRCPFANRGSGNVTCELFSPTLQGPSSAGREAPKIIDSQTRCAVFFVAEDSMTP